MKTLSTYTNIQMHLVMLGHQASSRQLFEEEAASVVRKYRSSRTNRSS